MFFECDKDLTLDDSAEIHVRSDKDEYIFSFCCNIKELDDLAGEVRRARALIVDKKDIEAMQKTKEFWNALNKCKDGIGPDVHKLLQEFREKRQIGALQKLVDKKDKHIRRRADVFTNLVKSTARKKK